MINKRDNPRKWASLMAAIALLGGCSESYTSGIVQNPAPGVEAVLVVSDVAATSGSSILVSVKANSTAGTVGSYTARINYDPAAVRYDGEVPFEDQALRAVNPLNGLVRLAGASASGFVDGRLASYRFVVLRAGGAKTLSLAVDEMHMLTRADAKTNLTIAPVRGTSR